MYLALHGQEFPGQTETETCIYPQWKRFVIPLSLCKLSRICHGFLDLLCFLDFLEYSPSEIIFYSPLFATFYPRREIYQT